MAQSDIAGGRPQMTRLATFMDQNGDEYDWYAVLGRYARGTSDNPDYERILWEFEGVLDT